MATVTRKNVSELSSNEKQELVKAIKALKTSGKYDQFVLRHAQAPMTNIHRCPAFLPWHRQFVRDYEEELQKAVNNSQLAVPYWDWAEDAARPDPKQAPIWGTDLLGGDGDANGIVRTGPFRAGEWTIVNSQGQAAGPLTRQFGVNVSTLSTQTDVDNALSTVPYDRSPWSAASNPSFRNRLEGWYGASGPGLHNRGHVWVGGSMLPMTSPNDPAFFFHHCFVDKLWADWQDADPANDYQPVSGGATGQNLRDSMEPGVNGSVTPESMLDYRALGYVYGSFNAGFDSGFLAPNGRIYITKGNRYVRYSDDDATTVDPGYPRPIKGNWGALPDRFNESFDSAFVAPNGRIYITRGDQYVRYSDQNATTVDSGYPRPIKGNWGSLPDSFNNGFDCAFVAPNGRIYITRGDQYVRYSDQNATTVDSGYPRPIRGNWGSLPDSFNNGFDSAFVAPNGKIYITRAARYVRYSDQNATTVDPGYPRPIKGNWGDLP